MQRALAATLAPDAAAPPRGHGRTRPFRLGATFVPDPEPEQDAGVWLGAAERYQVVRFLGQGGMGRVYEARRESDGRSAAVKVLRADRVAGNKAELVARFRQEVSAASRAGHRGIVEMLGFEKTPDGRVLVAMELLRGESLEDWLAKPGTLDVGLQRMAQLCDALHAAHAHGVLHRDIKPANLFLHREDDGTIRPTILDFGLAKVEMPDHTQIETAAGTVLGTPYYLAPERALGRGLDARADLYSVGVVLYEMVTGSLPFEAEAFMAILEGHVRQTPLDPRQAAADRPIPAAVSALVLSLLEKDPAARPRSAAEVAGALRGLLADHADVLAECPTGPRTKAAPGADTMSLRAQALGPTIAPTPDGGAAAVASPDAATLAPGGSMAFAPTPAPTPDRTDPIPARSGRRWLLIPLGITLVAAVAGTLAFAGASEDAELGGAGAQREPVGAPPSAEPPPDPDSQSQHHSQLGRSRQTRARPRPRSSRSSPCPSPGLRPRRPTPRSRSAVVQPHR